jgi:hypothetical protein
MVPFPKSAKYAFRVSGYKTMGYVLSTPVEKTLRPRRTNDLHPRIDVQRSQITLPCQAVHLLPSLGGIDLIYRNA